MPEETYWNNRGKYQKLYEQLFATLVPAEGEAPTRHGEIMRLTSLLYSEFHRGGAYMGAQYAYPLLTLIQQASGNVRAIGLANLLATGLISAEQLEEFADWVVLWVATQTAGESPVAPAGNGMILVAITDGDIQGMALAQQGRLLTAEELLALAQVLDPETRAYVGGYVRTWIQAGGAG